MFFGNNLLLPLWLQTQMGYIATWAGLVAAPSGVVAVLLTPFAARLHEQDRRPLAPRLWRSSPSRVSYFMRSLYTTDADFCALVIPMLVQGMAMSTFFVSMVTLSLNGVPPNAGAGGLGPLQLRAHHRRQLRRLPRHHLLGPQRGAAPDAAVRDHGRPRSRPSSWPLQKLQGAGHDLQQAVGAVTDQVVEPGLSAGHRRHLPDVGLADGGADPAASG